MKTRRSFLKEAAMAGAGGLILPGFMKFKDEKPKLS